MDRTAVLKMGIICNCGKSECKVCVLEVEQEKRSHQGKQGNCLMAGLAGMLYLRRDDHKCGFPPWRARNCPCRTMSRLPFIIRVILLPTPVESDERHGTAICVSRSRSLHVHHA